MCQFTGNEISVLYNIVCTFSALAYGPYSLTSTSSMIARTDLCIVCNVGAIYVFLFKPYKPLVCITLHIVYLVKTSKHL